MNNFLKLAAISVSALALTAACSREQAQAPSEAPSETASSTEADATVTDRRAKLEEMRAQFAVVEMDADVSFLTDEERAVVNKLNQV